jgi:transglutaminase-like putative cysteine protease
MKVLKPEGVNLARFAHTYPGRWDWMRLDQLEGKTIDIDESGKTSEYEVDKKSIYTQNVSYSLKKVSFAFPSVKVGSILECRYRMTYTGTNWLRSYWNFQSEFPVYKSSFYYRSHPETEVTYALQKSPDIPVSVTKQGSKGDAILFEMSNIPALEDEPFMDSRENYLQKVSFNVTRLSNSTGYRTVNSSWDELINFWNESRTFGIFLNTVSREVNLFVGSLTKGKSPFEKMKAVHEYVRNNIEYNNIQSIDAEEEDLLKVWHDKKGGSGDINLLLVYMLRSAGLQANPILISEAANGKIEKTFIDHSQFSNVYATVIIDGKRYYLDGTDKKTPSHLIQTEILNTSGLLIKGTTGEFITIEESESKDKRIVVVEATLDEDGQIAGTVQITSRDYGRMRVENKYNNDKSDYVEKHLLKQIANVKVDSFKISNIENDSLPLIENFSFKTNLQRSGDYDFVTLNMFTGFNANPFIAETRVSDVNFGFNSSYTTTYVLTLPPGKKVDAVPKNIQMVNEDKTLLFSRQVMYNEQANQLITRIKIETNKSVFPANEYVDLKEFYKKLSNLLEEQCVITKK